MTIVFECSSIYDCLVMTVCAELNFFFVYQACHIADDSATEVNQS